MSKQAFKRVRRALGMEVCRKPMDSFAWPGGYPLFYVCHDGGLLCADCVNAEIEAVDESIRNRLRDGWHVGGCDVHWEGEPLLCDHCGKEIESAYGDPDAQDNEPALED